MRRGKKRSKGIHFAVVFQDVFYGNEWKSLGRSAMIVYLYLKLGFIGSNNGEITLPYSTFTKPPLKWSSATFEKALVELVDKGWIEITFKGGLYRNCNKYKLTWNHDRYLKS